MNPERNIQQEFIETFGGEICPEFIGEFYSWLLETRGRDKIAWMIDERRRKIDESLRDWVPLDDDWIQQSPTMTIDNFLALNQQPSNASCQN